MIDKRVNLYYNKPHGFGTRKGARGCEERQNPEVSIMFEKIVEYASRQLEIDASEITRETTFESLGVDSLDIVEMTMDFEEKLGVELDMEDVKITTFGELADYIEEKLA